MALKKIIILSIAACLSTYSFADKPKKKPVKTVNAVAFWTFLDDPRLTTAIEKKCNVKFSHDIYYTNAEFLDIYNKHKEDYDIMIFSNLIYGVVKDSLPKIKSDLWLNSKNYYPFFKNYYIEHKYPHNTAFFTHAMMGFMYNPAVLSISPNQDIFEIFKEAKNNDVILVDDPAEAVNILTLGYKTSSLNMDKNFYTNNGKIELTYDNLKRVTQNSKVYITNDFNKIYERPTFGFSYIWSGDALLYIKQSKKPYKFVINPKLTSICTDLVAQMKDTPEARCVANALQDTEVLKYFQSATYYFTPYFQDNIKDEAYHRVYKEVKQNLDKMHWIEPDPNFANYARPWDQIKIKLDQTSN